MFRRCGACGKKVTTDERRRCPHCGAETITWTYEVDLAPPGAPRRRQRKGGFATKKAALTALNDVLSKLAEGSHVPASRLTVGEYLDEWLQSVRSGMRPGSFDASTIHVNAYIKPRLGGMRLQALGRRTVKAFYSELAVSGRRPARHRGLQPRNHLRECRYRARVCRTVLRPAHNIIVSVIKRDHLRVGVGDAITEHGFHTPGKCRKRTRQQGGTNSPRLSSTRSEGAGASAGNRHAEDEASEGELRGARGSRGRGRPDPELTAGTLTDHRTSEQRRADRETWAASVAT